MIGYSAVEVVLVDIRGADTLRQELMTAMIDGTIPGDVRSFGGTGAHQSLAWRLEDWPAVKAWLEARR